MSHTTLIAGFIECVRFVRHAAFLVQGGIRGDALIYFGMGRGILNGLRPYLDLFESKPPMVFWISAASLKIGGDSRFYLLLQSILIGAIPILLLWFALRISRSLDRGQRRLVAAFGLLSGACFASFIIDRTLGFQTEGFAVLAASVPAIIVVLYGDAKRMPLRCMTLAAICFAFSLLLKEPFLLSGVAAMVMVSRSKKDWVRIGCILAIAACCFMLALGLSHSLSDYFGMYLPEMMSQRPSSGLTYHDYRIDRIVSIPTLLLLRGLPNFRLLLNAFGPPTYWLLGFAIMILLLLRRRKTSRNTHWIDGLFGALLLGSTIVLMNESFLMMQVLKMLEIAGRAVPVHNSYFLLKCFELVGLVGLSMLSILWLIRQADYSVPFGCMKTIAALYIATLAVGIGGDYPAHHFVFAVPLYIAIVVDAMYSWSQLKLWSIVHRIAIGGILVLLMLQTVVPRYDYPKLQSTQRKELAAFRTMANSAMSLDEMMTACKFDRYFVGDDSLPAIEGFTTHSPYQLPYGMVRALGDSPTSINNPLRIPNRVLAAKLSHDIYETPFIILGSDTRGQLAFDGLDTLLKTKFNGKPPQCAERFVPLPAIEVHWTNRFDQTRGTAKPKPKYQPGPEWRQDW